MQICTHFGKCGTAVLRDVERMGRPAQFTIVEAGAGTGRLAEHILEFVCGALPAFFNVLHYVAVENDDLTRTDQLAETLSGLSGKTNAAHRSRFQSGFRVAAYFPTNCWMPWRFTA